MARLPILRFPDPRLHTVAKPVAEVDARIRQLVDDMLETMYAAPGIGLAAAQIGELKRVVVMDLGDKPVEGASDEPETEEEALERRNPRFFVNPEILWTSDELYTYEEGCLSIPDYYAEVERPASITVRHLDRDGKEQVTEAEGLLATCLQHEIDHLNGVLFIDHLSRLKRERVTKRFAKAARRESAA